MPDVWIAGCQSCRLSDAPNFAHPLRQIALWIEVSLIFKNKYTQYLVCTSPKPSGNDPGKRSINVGVTNHSSWSRTVRWAPRRFHIRWKICCPGSNQTWNRKNGSHILVPLGYINVWMLFLIHPPYTIHCGVYSIQQCSLMVCPSYAQVFLGTIEICPCKETICGYKYIPAYLISLCALRILPLTMVPTSWRSPFTSSLTVAGDKNHYFPGHLKLTFFHSRSEQVGVILFADYGITATGPEMTWHAIEVY